MITAIRFHTSIVILFSIFLGLQISAFAESVIIKHEAGVIDWSLRVIISDGVASSSENKSLAVGRLEAESQAIKLGRKKLLQLVNEVPVIQGKTIGKILKSKKSQQELQTMIDKTLPSQTRYLENRQVSVKYLLPLDGDLSKLVIQNLGKFFGDGESLDSTEEQEYSGIIIDASGFDKFQPSLFPKIFGGKKKEIISPKMIDPKILITRGMVKYYSSLDEAKKSGFFGVNPMVLNAVKGPSKISTDLFIHQEYAKLLEESGSDLIFQGKIAVIWQAE